jgi:hypothetical protein
MKRRQGRIFEWNYEFILEILLEWTRGFFSNQKESQMDLRAKDLDILWTINQMLKIKWKNVSLIPKFRFSKATKALYLRYEGLKDIFVPNRRANLYKEVNDTKRRKQKTVLWQQQHNSFPRFIATHLRIFSLFFDIIANKHEDGKK